MIKPITSILSAIVVAVGVGTAFGGGGRGGMLGAAPSNALGMNVNFYTNEYDLLAAQISLSDDQKPKVRQKVDAMNAELQLLLQAAQNVGAARGAAPAGPGGFGGAQPGGGRGVVAANAPLTPEQIKIRDDFQLVANQHQVKINGELTAEQQVQWETYKLNTFLEPKLVTLNLTDAQKEKVKVLVAESAKSLAAMTDGKDIDTHEGLLIRRIVSDILTEPQAARLFELPLGTTAGGRGALPAARGGTPANTGFGGRGAPSGAPGGGPGRG